MVAGTRERILDGAAAAVARHGIAKLEMSDVSASSGVSRGTLYRYFPGRDEILVALAQREGVRFKERVLAAIAQAPPGPERLQVALEHATRHVREHAALQRLLETDPALVLRGLREQFESLKREFGEMLAPLFAEVALVRRRVVGADQLVDWTMRLMVSAFLLPATEPRAMAQAMTAVYRMLSAEPGASGEPARHPPGTAASARGRAPGPRRRRSPTSLGDRERATARARKMR